MNEEPKRRKIDISSKVVGKVQNDEMVLYVDEREIGRMSLDGTEPRYQFEQNYGIEETKIYQIQTVGIEDEQYVEDCDMGWC